MGKDGVGAHDFLEVGEGGQGGIETVEVELEEAVAESLGEGAEDDGKGNEDEGQGGEAAEGEREEKRRETRDEWEAVGGDSERAGCPRSQKKRRTAEEETAARAISGLEKRVRPKRKPERRERKKEWRRGVVSRAN